MGKRRLGGVLLCAAVAVVVGGCAQGVGVKEQAAGTGKAGGESADALVARGAAGLERVLSGEQRPGVASAVSPGEPAQAAPPVARTTHPVAPATPPAPIADVKVVPTSSAERPVEGAVLSGWWEGAVSGSPADAGGAAPVQVSQPAAVSSFWKSDGGADGGGFRISALALCSRVEGFAKFSRVESVRATGRAVPLLIYTQLDGFSYRTRDGSVGGVEDGKSEWVVELGQSVAVYRVAAAASGAAGAAGGGGDVLVKVEPEQTARDVALFKRRDHFLVQRIELPTPVVAGKYVVKVSVRDKATGMVDERTAEVVVR